MGLGHVFFEPIFLITFSLINHLVWRAFPAVLAGFSRPLIRLEVPEIPTSVPGLLPARQYGVGGSEGRTYLIREGTVIAVKER